MVAIQTPLPPDTGNWAAHVERELTLGAKWLRFSREIEEIYVRETRARHLSQLTFTAFIALALYNLFLIADYILIGDVIAQAIILRLVVVTPLSVLIYLLMRRGPLARYQDFLAALNVVLVVSSTAYLLDQSHDPNRLIYNQSFLLVIVYACLIQRLHFWYALGCSVVSNVIFTVSLVFEHLSPIEQPIGIEIIAIVGTIFTLVAAYAMEREHRLFYLITLKERLHAEAMEGISNRDALTGLLNRRALDRELAHLRSTATSGRQQGLAVIILDIDHFKIYNDRLGHQAGDDCLRQVARLILSHMRQGQDDAFRYGGEEFLLLVRESDSNCAIAVAERIRVALEAQAIPHPQSSAGAFVTASFGVAHADHAQASPSDIIARADMALYAAKNNGRNRVWPPITFQSPSHLAERI